MTDPVDHPQHYTSHPSGIECIQVTEHMSFNLGNAVKYLWRADLKGDAVQDLRKAAWYITREIDRRKTAAILESHRPPQPADPTTGDTRRGWDGGTEQWFDGFGWRSVTNQ